MGAVSFHADTRLVRALLDVQPFARFIETGTFHGDTVDAMRTFFPQVVSIELSVALHAAACERFRGLDNIEILLGDSAILLASLPRVRGTLYYLDAHWCAADDTAGQTSQCPVLAELAAIGPLDDGSVVLIDDARLFLATPAHPHEVSQWPSLQQLLDELRSVAPGHRIMVVNDVVAVYPPEFEPAVIGYARRHGVDWLAAAHSLAADPSLRADLEAKEQVIGSLLATQRMLQTQVTSQNDVRAAIQDAQQVREALEQALVQKEQVIRQQQQALTAYRAAFPLLRPVLPAWRAGRGMLRLLEPKLGRLHHHEPLPASWPASRTLVPQGAVPRISVVTPSFRQARFLGRTIDSVLLQNYPALEYFVQDGGSDDGSVEVLQSYSDQLSGWVSEPDGGQSQAINAGFARTSGELMAWLNSDDLLLPGALATVADYFATHPQVDVVYGHRILIDEEDREIGRWVLPPHSDTVLSWADFVPQETLFWRRSLWEKVGGIDESFRFAMDWDLLLRFRDAGARMVRLPCFLGAFRIHEAQKTSAVINQIGMQEMARLRRRALGRDVSYAEIRRALVPYMVRHLGHDLAIRVRRRLGGAG